MTTTVTTGICATCGHVEALHLPIGTRGCLAQVDTRATCTGGPNLAPCACSGFVAVPGTVKAAA